MFGKSEIFFDDWEWELENESPSHMVHLKKISAKLRKNLEQLPKEETLGVSHAASLHRDTELFMERTAGTMRC
ncbi:Lanosterol 14-Alpha Demethylase [Manis pentadactyla]|nr:Lanosterol 14-Alpha Demethylase [Manis pentadactyla]